MLFIGDGMSGMANFAKISDPDQFGKSVKTVSESICGLIECTAQAAYLVAVSDPTSMAGRPGLVDQAQFARASQVIQQACANIANPTSNEQQVTFDDLIFIIFLNLFIILLFI